MSDLEGRLQRLGLSQYVEVLVSEGFDTWETVLDITESDLNALNFKLGHRRKLQRAIAESRGQSSDRPLPIAINKTASAEGPYRSDNDSAPETKGKEAEAYTTQAAATATKRKYRRHPKPDEHAPERPPSAYVIFSNQVRETLKGQDLSFTEIAKVVGERWQVLAANDREMCERQANSAKEKYYAELAEYKRTPQFDAYQRYLEEFKTKHADPPKAVEGKRSKLETETSTSTRSSSHDQGDRSSKRISNTQFEGSTTGHHRTESSPPIGPARLPSAPLYPSKSMSPATHPLSALNSPRISEPHYSPLSASPHSVTLNRDASFEFQPSALGRDSRSQSDTHMSHQGTTYGHTYQPQSTTPPAIAFPSHYQAYPIDLPSRRSNREPTRLPTLSHEDTTLSSDSGGHSNPSYPPPSFPSSLDAQKSMRVLPQPVPSVGPMSSPFDRHLPTVPSSQQYGEFPPMSSLATLARVGEMASAGQLPRVEDDMDMDKEGFP